MSTKLQPVFATKDDDGHWYVIPKDQMLLFCKLLDEGLNDEWEEFNERFGQYRTGGDLNLIQLYAEI